MCSSSFGKCHGKVCGGLYVRVLLLFLSGLDDGRVVECDRDGCKYLLIRCLILGIGKSSSSLSVVYP